MGGQTGRVFIGHGQSPVWKDLRDFLRDRLSVDWEEFNRDSPAGLSTPQRLEEMLEKSCFAFLVMTAEDEHLDGSLHARENVIHEMGLFQGRLGFKRAIVLLEEDCREFSNIYGLTQIRFPKGNIEAKSEEIRRVLEREGIPGDGQKLRPKQLVNNDDSPGTVQLDLKNEDARYLMSLSRKRNESGIPLSMMETFASRETAESQETLDRFVAQGLMRSNGRSLVLTHRGYLAADEMWHIHILRELERLQTSQWEFVGIEQISAAVTLTDGEPEALELQRHLTDLAKLQLIEPVRAQGGIAGARITDGGRAQTRLYSIADFSRID